MNKSNFPSTTKNIRSSSGFKKANQNQYNIRQNNKSKNYSSLEMSVAKKSFNSGFNSLKSSQSKKFNSNNEKGKGNSPNKNNIDSNYKLVEGNRETCQNSNKDQDKIVDVRKHLNDYYKQKQVNNNNNLYKEFMTTQDDSAIKHILSENTNSKNEYIKDHKNNDNINKTNINEYAVKEKNNENANSVSHRANQKKYNYNLNKEVFNYKTLRRRFFKIIINLNLIINIIL